MSQDVYIFEVTADSFPSVVVQNSEKLPVLVEFMGVWSEPCFVMSELFSLLAKEFAGQFIFAKVDIDEQKALLKKYGIENVPTLLVFHHGQQARREEGQLQESEARAILNDFGIAHASDKMREQAREKHLAGDTAAAIVLLTQAIQQHPSNTRVAMDMVQIFLDIGELENAKGLFNKLPERDQQSDMGKALSGQLGFLELAGKTAGLDALLQRVSEAPEDYQARFDLAICQVAKHQYQNAMEHLFAIQTASADFQNGAAKEMIITLIRMLTPSMPAEAQDYQRRLSNLLAK